MTTLPLLKTRCGQIVNIRYSKRKSVALHVKQGQIELRAPYRTDPAFLEAFLNSRQQWLARVLSEQAQKARDQIDYSLANRIPFMGFDVSVHRHRRPGRPSWSLQADGLELNTPDMDDKETGLALLTDFYKAQARFWLKRKTEEQVTRAGLTARWTDIKLRKTKTKWGHCTHDGRIQYNWLIMMAPEPVIDYLVCHEVSHLKHLDHSPAFWNHVAQLHPTYQEDRRWLRANEHRLVLES